TARPSRPGHDSRRPPCYPTDSRGLCGPTRMILRCDIGEAVMLALLDVVDLLGVVGHGAVLGVDQPALVVPVEAERVAVAARVDLRLLLSFGRVEAEDGRGEV